MWNTTRRPSALLFILLFATEGHVSSGVRSIGLEELIQRSDAILLVQKALPYEVTEKWPLPDTTVPPFEALAYRFQVLQVIKESSPIPKGKPLLVFSEGAEDNYLQTKNALENRPVRMTLHPYYDGKAIDPKKEKKFLIFVRYDEAKRRYSFAANGAMESEKNLDPMKKALQGPTPRAGK